MHRYASLAAAALATALSATPVFAEVIGKVGVDWMGNDIIVDAMSHPKVKGVTCHVTYFDRGVLDRLKNGNWFEDPSNNSIACRQTGPIEIDDIELSKEGEEDFLAKADASVVAIYSQMRPDAASQQIAVMDPVAAAAILSKLNPRIASAILNEMNAQTAAMLTNVMAGLPQREGKPG